MPRRDNRATSSASDWRSLHCQFCQARRPGSLGHLRVWLLGRAVRESINFFDVRVFNPSAPSNQQPQKSATYRKHEKEKRNHYEHRVNEIERSSFTPLVFSTTAGMGPSALTFYRRLADLLGERRNTPFNVIMAWMRTRLSFALLRASIMC